MSCGVNFGCCVVNKCAEKGTGKGGRCVEREVCEKKISSWNPRFEKVAARVGRNWSQFSCPWKGDGVGNGMVCCLEY